MNRPSSLFCAPLSSAKVTRSKTPPLARRPRASADRPVRRGNLRYPHARHRQRRRSARLDPGQPSGIGRAHHLDQRRYRQQRNAIAAGAQRHSLHREAFQSATPLICCGENLRETMSHEIKTRLLVVDDEQSIRRLCMTIGTTLGFVCAEAESAEVALSRLDTETPDLLLTDLKLPTKSGVDLVGNFRSVSSR